MIKAASLLFLVAALCISTTERSRAQADPEPPDYYTYRDSLIAVIHREADP